MLAVTLATCIGFAAGWCTARFLQDSPSPSSAAPTVVVIKFGPVTQQKR